MFVTLAQEPFHLQSLLAELIITSSPLRQQTGFIGPLTVVEIQAEVPGLAQGQTSPGFPESELGLRVWRPCSSRSPFPLTRSAWLWCLSVCFSED